jgi:hypothetical protein
MKMIFLSVLVAGLFAGCSKSDNEPGAQGSMSINVEKATESAKEGLQKAGKEIEKGAEKAKEKLQEAGEVVSEKVKEAKDELTNDDKPSIEVEVKKN